MISRQAVKKIKEIAEEKRKRENVRMEDIKKAYIRNKLDFEHHDVRLQYFMTPKANLRTLEASMS